MIAWDMSLMLEGAGFEVAGIVVTAAAALRQAAAAAPDVILMDVAIRGEMDGIEVARALRARGVRTPIVFVTGYDDPETAARIGAVNPEGYLRKPLLAEELEQAVRRAIEPP